MNVHDNKHLQHAVNKYGIENFVFDIIEYCNPEDLQEIEQYYLDMYEDDWEGIYNIAKDTVSPNRGKIGIGGGWTHSEETKAEYSRTRTGTSNSFYGKTHTEETRWKISLAQTGRKHSEETIKKCALARSGEKNCWYGTGSKVAIEASRIANSKAVYMLDKITKEIIMEFSSITEAANYINKPFGFGLIGKSAKKENSSAYGYGWRLKEN